jgi:type VI secretion system secreted protein VgrG
MVLACFASSASAQSVSLGTAANFGVLGGSTVTNTGSTVVNGNVGVWAGTSITGFPPGSIFPGSGSMHSADAIAQQAQSDLTAAYTDAAGRVCGTTIAGDLLGGLTLTPGVYCMGAGSLTGTLTLDGTGVYIFQTASSLTTASGASVVLLNGASACDVFWQVTSSATIGTSTGMAGNLLALNSITLNTGASLSGRALARNGAVTLDSNNVTACTAAAGQTPTTLSTLASAAAQPSGAIHDTATLAGGTSPTGTIIFQLFGPGNASCTGTPIFTSTITVAGNGSYDSAAFTPAAAGTYQWIAAYSGDAVNAASVTACNDPNESVTTSGLVAVTPILSAWSMIMFSALLLGFAAMRNQATRTRRLQ